jgi:hypothetical protein
MAVGRSGNIYLGLLMPLSDGTFCTAVSSADTYQLVDETGATCGYPGKTMSYYQGGGAPIAACGSPSCIVAGDLVFDCSAGP